MEHEYRDGALIDDYIHVADNITYIKENIPCTIDLNDPETLQIHENFSYEFSENCSCTLECSMENQCPCILKFGQNYQKLKEYRSFILNENNIDIPHFECGTSCLCPNVCSNRVVQHGPTRNLSVLPIAGKGFGLKTEVDLHKCSFVCEYAGEVLSTNLAKYRYQNNKVNGSMNYIFCLNEIVADGKVIKTYVDPSEFGNIGRYLNHSCVPNCFVVPIRVNINVPKLCIFAARDIKNGEELTFDYGAGKNQQNGGNPDTGRMPCLCGEDLCRKWLPCDLGEIL